MKKAIFYENSINSYVAFTLANSCMPTLLKLKPASLVNFNKKYTNNKIDFMTTLQYEISQFHVKYEILYENDVMYCILIYHYDFLNNVIQKFHNNKLIFSNDYQSNDYQSDNVYLTFYLSILKRRYRNYMEKIIIDFPHEVGIFLGYPMIDVAEYIKNKGENYLLSGYWKVYHNVNKAKRTFFTYTKIRECSLELINSGKCVSEINKLYEKNYFKI
jgi:hypothetical protein